MPHSVLTDLTATVFLGGLFAAALLLLGQGASMLFALHERRGARSPSQVTVLAPYLATSGLLILWLASFALELLANSDALAVRAHRLSYFAIIGVPISIFTLVWGALGSRLRRSHLVLLAPVPLISIALNFYPPLAPWFWVESEVAIWGPFRVVSTERGGWFWVHIAYSYALLGGSLVRLLLRYARQGTRAWAETAAVGAALLFPWLLNVVHVLVGAIPLDPTPISAAVSVMWVSWALQRSRVLAVLPASRAKLLDGVPDPILVFDSWGRLIDSNEAARGLLSPDVWVRLPGGSRASVEEALRSRIGESSVPGDLAVEHATGPQLFEVDIQRLVDPLAEAGALVVFRDVTEVREARRAVRDLERIDGATRLMRRTPFRALVREALLRCESTNVLILLDLDGFRDINRELGHERADGVLRDVGQALRRCQLDLHMAGDDRRAEAARVGPDEFALYVEGVVSEEAAVDIAEQACRACQVAVNTDGGSVRLTLSAGLALAPRDGADVGSLWSAADAALHEAKLEGGHVAKVYRPRFSSRDTETRRIQHALSGATQRGEMRLVYQPRFDLQFEVPGFSEALLRWDHPELGVVSPADFVPIAEDSGQIVDIGAWVLREACRQLSVWRKRNVPIPGVAVNVSAVQLEDPLFFDFITQSLREGDLKPSDLELEITERTLLEDSEPTNTAIRDLRAIGVTLSIDDFGTGYATLRSLVQGQFDSLKLDRSLVEEIDRDPGRIEIAGAILRMAWPLGLSVVAEGVEREEEVEVLRRLGCHSIQGYHYSRPLEPDALADFLNAVR